MISTAAARGSDASSVGTRGTTWVTFRTIRRARSFAWLIPFAIATAYIVIYLLQLPDNVVALTWNSDIASAFTIPETLVRTGTDGHTVLASTGAYISLWFGLLTASLPLHRELWEISATLVFLATALTIGWCVSQIATRRQAALGVLLALVVMPPTFIIFMAAATHNIIYLGTALLGAHLVWMARIRQQRVLTTLTISLLAGVALGLCLASVLLLLVTGVIPFAVVAVLSAIQRNRRSRLLGLSALLTIAVAIPIARITSLVMHSLGFVIEGPSTQLSPLSAISLHSRFLFEGLKQLFGGYLADQQAPETLQVVAGIAADVVMAMALLMLLIFGAQAAIGLIRSSLRRDDAEPGSLSTARALHVAYWSGSAVSTVIAFELSVKADGTHPQYYATLILSVAAVAPILAHRTSVGRWAVPAAISVLFAIAVVALANNPLSITQLGRDAPEIERLAKANHATTGYGGYWYSSSLTWNSRNRLNVRPVGLCENPAGADICPFYLNRVPSWYRGSARRSFLLVESQGGFLTFIPPGLGRPLASYLLKGSIWMYVYPYDLASRLGPGPD